MSVNERFKLTRERYLVSTFHNMSTNGVKRDM